MNVNKFVFILPTSDYLDYGSCVLRKVIRESVDVGDHYRALEGGDATPENVESAVKGVNPALVAGIGHGSPCAYTVQDKEFLLMCLDPSHGCDTDMNMGLVGGRVWFLNSCHVGEELGKVMVEEYGAVAFLGSNAPYLFPVFAPPCTDFDVMAAFTAEYAALHYLLRGFTVKEAHNARLKAYDELIREYTVGSRKTSPNAQLIVRLLRVDKDIAVFYGDGSAIVATAEPQVKSALMHHPMEAGVGAVAIVIGGLALLSEAISKLKRKAS